MKKILFLIIAVLLMFTVNVKAEEITFYTAKSTAYCYGTQTASGKKPMFGMVASRPEWIGKSMVIWLDDGSGIVQPKNFLGIFDIEDTGGEPIKKGWVVDLYMSNKADCDQWGCKNIIFQIIEGKG